MDELVQAQIDKTNEYGFFTLSFTSVLREGFEAAIFVVGFGAAYKPESMPIPIVTGIFAGVAFGASMFVGTNKMDLSFFFKFSAGFLALIAAGLGSHASYEFQKGEAFGAWGCKRICDDVWVPAVQAPFGTYASYVPYTDIAPHAAIDLDMRAFSDRMQADPPDFDGAWEIYDQGGNSVKGDGFRTLRGFSKDLSGEPTYDEFLAYHGDARPAAGALRDEHAHLGHGLPDGAQGGPVPVDVDVQPPRALQRARQVRGRRRRPRGRAARVGRGLGLLRGLHPRRDGVALRVAVLRAPGQALQRLELLRGRRGPPRVARGGRRREQRRQRAHAPPLPRGPRRRARRDALRRGADLRRQDPRADDGPAHAGRDALRVPRGPPGRGHGDRHGVVGPRQDLGRAPRLHHGRAAPRRVVRARGRGGPRAEPRAPRRPRRVDARPARPRRLRRRQGGLPGVLRLPRHHLRRRRVPRRDPGPRGVRRRLDARRRGRVLRRPRAPRGVGLQPHRRLQARDGRDAPRGHRPRRARLRGRARGGRMGRRVGRLRRGRAQRQGRRPAHAPRLLQGPERREDLRVLGVLVVGHVL